MNRRLIPLVSALALALSILPSFGNTPSVSGQIPTREPAETQRAHRTETAQAKTETARPTNTPLPTNTNVPPTATTRPTNTNVPPSNTPVPTDTLVPTNTPEPTFTLTQTPNAQETVNASNAATATQLAIVSSTKQAIAFATAVEVDRLRRLATATAAARRTANANRRERRARETERSAPPTEPTQVAMSQEEIDARIQRSIAKAGYTSKPRLPATGGGKDLFSPLLLLLMLCALGVICVVAMFRTRGR